MPTMSKTAASHKILLPMVILSGFVCPNVLSQLH